VNIEQIAKSIGTTVINKDFVADIAAVSIKIHFILNTMQIFYLYLSSMIMKIKDQYFPTKY